MTTKPVESTPNSYDEVPYESHPYPQSHPSRLFTVATLFGLAPPAVATARILELGCASGGNLVPIAEQLPETRIVGIDQSARQIADGLKVVEELGLTNLSLRHASIMDVDASFGTFDYIICHGVFSWVPTEVREKILSICAERLSPSGVAYISYNTYPGWHMRGMIRDMMRYHAAKYATPRHKTQHARALLDFLADSVRNDGGPFSLLLHRELDGLRHQGDHYLFHEHLEENNDPLYFHDFVDMAGRHGLRYLGESRIGTMMTSGFNEGIEKALKVLAPDQIQSEQYMDFLRNRMFRETLLVRSPSVPNWALQADRVRRLHIASGSRPETDPGDLNSPEAVKYRTPSGQVLGTSHPVLKTAMAVLRDAWPNTMTFDALFAAVQGRLGRSAGDEKTSQEHARGLATGILNSYLASDLYDLYGHAVQGPIQPGERPKTLPSVRLRAREGLAVVNRRHENIRLSDVDRRMAVLLDGSRDRGALLSELTRIAAEGNIRITREEKPVTDPSEVRRALESILEQSLTHLAKSGVLVD